MAHLAHIAEYLPDGRLTNEQLAHEFPDWSVEKIAKKTGIENRPIAAENQTAVDLAIGACEQLFKEIPSARDDVDFFSALHTNTRLLVANISLHHSRTTGTVSPSRCI